MEAQLVIEASFVRTEDGLVIREIGVSGECAWRINNDRTWARCLDHKGPWVSIAENDVPLRVLYALDQLREVLAKEER